MRFPFDKYKLGTKFGDKGEAWKSGYHSGLDLYSISIGGDGRVHPIYEGVVSHISSGGSYGTHIRVLHPDGYISLYAHLSRVAVKVGDAVYENTVIGVEGSTGNSTGTHLHVEIHKGKYSYPAKIDPLAFISDGIKRSEDKMSKAKIVEVITDEQARVAALPESEWSKAEGWWAKAAAAGIVNGENPRAPITREEVIAVLGRLGLIK